MRKTIVVGAALGVAAGASAMAVRAYRTWGVDPADTARPMPGDELVPEPSGTITRSIVIDASPGAIWPWLAQMGYGRGGWYSYDRLDMKGRSALEIKPEWQRLAVGDIVPTDPRGGFEAKVVEPSHALVMYTDTTLVETQRGTDWRLPADESVTAGLRLSGAMLQTTPTQFKVSWAIVLDPIGEARTRLLERVRVRYDGPIGPGASVMSSLVGFGVFVMIRRQMLNLRELASGVLGSGPISTRPEVEPTHDSLDREPMPEVMTAAGIS